MSDKAKSLQISGLHLHLALEPNFCLKLALIQEAEVGRYTGKKCWRHSGWETVEHRLIKVLERLTFQRPGSLVGLLPPNFPEAFITADIAVGLTIPMGLAQKMAYCLREMGVLNMLGK